MGLKSRSNKKSVSGSHFPCTTWYTAHPSLQYNVMPAGIIQGVLSRVELAGTMTPEITSMLQCKLIFVWTTFKVSLLGCYHNFKVHSRSSCRKACSCLVVIYLWSAFRSTQAFFTTGQCTTNHSMHIPTIRLYIAPTRRRWTFKLLQCSFFPNQADNLCKW